MKYLLKEILLFVLILFGYFIHAQQLKVMTYNIRLDVASDGENAWPLRKDFFASQIRFYEPDIFGVQEALPHQVLDLEQLLTQYNQVGMGREGFEKGESSNIFYKKDKLKVVATNTFWLSETPEKISMGWDAACNRVCTYSLFKDLINNRFFWVFNTHLDHIGKEARTKGIELICSKINELNSQNFPVILMGDFNLEPHEKPIQWLKTIMDDTSEKAMEKPFGPIGTFNNFEFLTPVTKRIDYIFISKNKSLNVKKYAVLSDSKNGRYPSDHLPVYVEFK